MARRFSFASGLLASTILCSTTVVAQEVQSETGVMQLDAITVNGTKSDRLAIDSPESVSVITLEKIEETIPASVGDLLEDVPGVEMGGGPRGMDEQPSVRGLGGNRVVIRIDGVRKNYDAGHRGRGFIDPALLRQVDVVRGPASTIHGAGALSGAIAMETKTASDFLKGDEQFGIRLRQGWLSNSDGWLDATVEASAS